MCRLVRGRRRRRRRPSTAHVARSDCTAGGVLFCVPDRTVPPGCIIIIIIIIVVVGWIEYKLSFN